MFLCIWCIESLHFYILYIFTHICCFPWRVLCHVDVEYVYHGVRLRQTKCASSILIFFICMFWPSYILLCSRTNSCSPANVICWLKPTENKAYCIVLYCIVLYCIVLHCIALCIVLYCIVALALAVAVATIIIFIIMMMIIIIIIMVIIIMIMIIIIIMGMTITITTAMTITITIMMIMILMTTATLPRVQ